jgi:hypothetical protein
MKVNDVKKKKQARDSVCLSSLQRASRKYRLVLENDHDFPPHQREPPRLHRMGSLDKGNRGEFEKV